MTPTQRTAALATIWEAMIERVERLHDDAVLGQSRASSRTATQLLLTAEEIAALVRAVIALRRERR